jgi:hypothetical protein
VVCLAGSVGDQEDRLNGSMMRSSYTPMMVILYDKRCHAGEFVFARPNIARIRIGAVSQQSNLLTAPTISPHFPARLLPGASSGGTDPQRVREAMKSLQRVSVGKSTEKSFAAKWVSLEGNFLWKTEDLRISLNLRTFWWIARIHSLKLGGDHRSREAFEREESNEFSQFQGYPKCMNDP